MRQITLADVMDTFIHNSGEEALQLVAEEDSTDIGEMLTNEEALEQMGVTDEDDVIRVMVMVFGAFTAGAMTAKRLMAESTHTNEGDQ